MEPKGEGGVGGRGLEVTGRGGGDWDVTMVKGQSREGAGDWTLGIDSGH